MDQQIESFGAYFTQQQTNKYLLIQNIITILYIKIIFRIQMGSNQSKCNTCSTIICSQCKGCSNCVPIRNCKRCLQETQINIKILISFQDLKQIQDNGIIQSIQAKASKISSSKIPFTRKILHHLFLFLTINCGNKTKIFAIEGTRSSGKMQIQINYGQKSVNQFQKIEGINKRFSDLYDYAWKNEHNKQYHRYTSNCYHLVINFMLFLQPDIKYQAIKQINQYKDKQIENYWVLMFLLLYLIQQYQQIQ